MKLYNVEYSIEFYRFTLEGSIFLPKVVFNLLFMDFKSTFRVP